MFSFFKRNKGNNNQESIFSSHGENKSDNDLDEGGLELDDFSTSPMEDERNKRVDNNNVTAIKLMIMECKRRNIPNSELLTRLKDSGFPAIDILAAGFRLSYLKFVGFTAKELKDAGVRARQLKEADYSIKSLIEAGFSVKDFRYAEFSSEEIKEAGFSAKDLKDEEFRIDAYNLKSMGVSVADISTKELKEKGFNAEEILVGLTKVYSSSKTLTNAKLMLSELRKAEFSSAELMNAWYCDFGRLWFHKYGLEAVGLSEEESIILKKST